VKGQKNDCNDAEAIAEAKAVRCAVLVFRGGMSTRFPGAAEQPFLAAFAVKPEIVLCPDSGHFPSTTEPGRNPDHHPVLYTVMQD